MAEWVLKVADARGEIHHHTVEAETEQELRDKYTQQGYLVYSVRRRGGVAALPALSGRRPRLNMERFLVFNQQFVTLVKAGLPILKGLELLAERLTDPRLSQHISAVRDEVRNGALLSEAFRRQGVFPGIYVTSVMAGEKSGSLAEVLDRYVAYQKLALAVRKKLILSLIYPSLLVALVIGLVVFLITYVVPSFAELYKSLSAQLPQVTLILIAVGTTARNYVLAGVAALAVAAVAFRFWARGEAAAEKVDRIKLRTPLAGEIWIKYQVAQFARILGTLLVGGIPLVQALETASESVGSGLLRKALQKTERLVKEGQPLSAGLTATGIIPGLAVDMIEVGESTGALPTMLASVAEFYEDDVNTRLTAALSLIEPSIMIFMGMFVAFVLVALYLPIFSLADTLR
ncbi:MAG: type II secretion system F family protein [Acidobacteria bacterium]|nr:type II secretion system F family protein [Acidobacteriota bacterium]